MKQLKYSKKSLGLAGLVLVVLAIPMSFLLYHNANTTTQTIPAYVPTSDYAKGVNFTATITQDGCVGSRITGDIGCSLELDHSLTISVSHGNVMQTKPWGQTLNFPPYPTDPTGKHVTVYAHQVGPKEYTLEGSADYYVKITN